MVQFLANNQNIVLADSWLFRMYNAGIVQVILPQLLEFCGTKQFQNATEELPLSTAWVNGKSTLRLTLLKKEWRYILAALRPRDNLFIEMAQKHAAEIMVPSSNLYQLDQIDIKNLVTLPHRRLANKRWRETGILLPYGHSAKGFNVLNP
jgi:hypothetical protein